MSSYIDHYDWSRRPGENVNTLTHSWDRHTAARLAWLYGPLHVSERWGATRADLAAWNVLGRRAAA